MANCKATVETLNHERSKGKNRRRLFSFWFLCKAILVIWAAYVLVRPYFASDGPIFVYNSQPYLTDSSLVSSPDVRPGEVLVAYFNGHVRRECDRVTYIRQFIKKGDEGEEVVKSLATGPVSLRPGIYRLRIAQKVPSELMPGKWTWREVEIAECYKGRFWKSSVDMRFSVI